MRPRLEDLVPDSSTREFIEENVAAIEAGNLLRCFRRKGGFTQQNMADKLHTSLEKIDQLEAASDLSGPTYGFMLQFASACGIDLTQVILKAVLPEDAYKDTPSSTG